MAILKDRYGRILRYVRISITDRCNFRCRYCMPPEGIELYPHDQIMSYEDIFYLVEVLNDLGVEKIRLTGGEPFVRPDFTTFLKSFSTEFKDLKIAVTTNGSFLKDYAEEINSSGIDALNVSLDTLSEEKFKFITRSGTLSDVKEGLELFSGHNNIRLSLNTVLIRNFNVDEIENLINFANSRSFLPRFIEYMPINDDLWGENLFVPASDIFRYLPGEEWKNITDNKDKNPGPARYYENYRTGQIVGIIAAVSDHFCENCNRLRISATGDMQPCLFSNNGVPLLEHIRNRNKEKLVEGIYSAVALKPSGWDTSAKHNNNMYRIGG